MRRIQNMVVCSILICSGLMSGCSVLQPGIVGSGVVQSQSRAVGSFDQVELSGFGTVNIMVGESPSVTVTTDDNIVEHVKTKVVAGKLTIKPTSMIRPRSGLHVDVTVPELVAVKVSGAGDIQVVGVVGESLELGISGAGAITAQGQVDHVSARISGAGDADLQSLIARSAGVTISGAGSISLYASYSVDAVVSGAGSVVCFGNPIEVSQRVSGAGSIKTINEHPESEMGTRISAKPVRENFQDGFQFSR